MVVTKVNILDLTVKFLMKKKDHFKNRPPPKQKRSNPTPPPPLVSLGTRQRDLLRYMSTLSGRFNRKAYCRKYNLPPSSIKTALEALVKYGLVDHSGLGIYVVSTKGGQWVELSQGGRNTQKPLRSGGRNRESFSTHSSKFTINILDDKHFTPKRLTSLHPKEIKTLRFVNMLQHILYFDGATIVIKLKTVEIHIHDIVSGDFDENHLNSVNLALSYVKSLWSVGIKGDKFSLHSPHYANFDSVMADFLSRDGVGYRVDLGDGCSYWVDFSPADRLNHSEDETDSLDFRKRLDFFMQDLNSSHSNFSDVDKMKEILGLIVRLEASRALGNFPDTSVFNSGDPVNLKGDKPNYFG